MKTICAALGMAALLTFSASADTLTLSKDQILDFGDAVDVLDGSRTYFGKQIKDWAEHKNFGKTAETVSHDLKEKTNEKRRKPRLVWRRRKSRTVWRKKYGRIQKYTSFVPIRPLRSTKLSLFPFR